ncbi:hypothetical protein [Blastococcus tunisiensis]|uniref:Uncharacterized protein n=1 Tax=Blastococcus tunisiensis TaxID=1798228 RepID=A0A1I2ACT8_9ACTN|nr:hypothetical protein [Blastococcus sp. DSM 46838]SFE41629.1 hypothetical protein SAMN05216574_103283 [Blastococcus sp. DSM 46838]
MLELGKPGTAGTPTGVAPVLRDGVVVAALAASNWKDSATARIGDREWVFSRHKGELTGRRAAEPEGSARVRARKVSSWKGTWTVELEGTRVEVESGSVWKGTHRFLSGGRQVAVSGSSGGWSPRPTLDAEPAIPLDHQVFLLWLELVIRRRNTAAMTAVTAGAVAGGS